MGIVVSLVRSPPRPPANPFVLLVHAIMPFSLGFPKHRIVALSKRSVGQPLPRVRTNTKANFDQQPRFLNSCALFDSQLRPVLKAIIEAIDRADKSEWDGINAEAKNFVTGVRNMRLVSTFNIDECSAREKMFESSKSEELES